MTEIQPAKKTNTRLTKRGVEEKIFELILQGTPESINKASVLSEILGKETDIKQVLELKLRREGLTTDNMAYVLKYKDSQAKAE